MTPSGDSPAHVAIIMDGNGRWAKARGLPRVAGHRAGVEALRKTVRAVGDLGIPWLTVYAFSSENWSRPKSEVSDPHAVLVQFGEVAADEQLQQAHEIADLGLGPRPVLRN